MDKIREFIEIFQISDEEALSALLGCFGPPQASAIRGYWVKHEHFGFSAPSTAEIRQVYESNDFRCRQCGSQNNISIDHANGNSKDHSLSNLVLLCRSCNRAKSRRPTVNHDHKLKIYEATLSIYKEAGSFPKTKEEVRKIADVKQIGGVTYFLDYMKVRLEQHSVSKRATNDITVKRKCSSGDSIHGIFRRLILSQEDLQQAANFAAALKEMLPAADPFSKESNIQRALSTAIVIAYCRPFSGNDRSEQGPRRPGLDLNTKLTFEEKQLHERLIKKRNKVHAHSDLNIRRLSISVMDFGGSSLAVPIGSNPFLQFEEEEVIAIESLIENVMRVLATRITEIQEELEPGERF